MLPLLLSAIVFVFLLLGAAVFLLCAAVPFLRRYALSAALWCALWGPAIAAMIVAAVVSLAAAVFISRTDIVTLSQWSRFAKLIGWGYVSAGCLSIGIVASAIAWLHQYLLHRLTFPLFRLYAALVSAGVGSVFGWTIEFVMVAKGAHLRILWIATMCALIAGFGLCAYKWAASLRGPAPDTFTWISPAEFGGI